MELEAVAKTLGSAGVIGGAVWTVYKKALKPMMEIVKARYAALEAIPSIQNDLKLIREQLVPNGGASLRDSIHGLLVL